MRFFISASGFMLLMGIPRIHCHNHKIFKKHIQHKCSLVVKLLFYAVPFSLAVNILVGSTSHRFPHFFAPSKHVNIVEMKRVHNTIIRLWKVCAIRASGAQHQLLNCYCQVLISLQPVELCHSNCKQNSNHDNSLGLSLHEILSL